MFHISGFADELGDDFLDQMRFWKAMGLSWFELRSAWKVNVLDLSDDQVHEIKRIIDGEGIRVSCIGSPLGKTNIEDSETIVLDKLKRGCELAKYFDCNRVRVFSFYSRTGEILSKKEEVFARLRKMVSYAASQKVELLHENERNIYGEHSQQCREIAEALHSKYFGLVFDPANYSFVGEDVKQAEQVMHDYITYIHVKDYCISEKVTKIPGMGDSSIAYVFDQHRNQDIFISMEPHLDAIGQFGGATSPPEYEQAVVAVRKMLTQLDIRYN